MATRLGKCTVHSRIRLYINRQSLVYTKAHHTGDHSKHTQNRREAANSLPVHGELDHSAAQHERRDVGPALWVRQHERHGEGGADVQARDLRERGSHAKIPQVAQVPSHHGQGDVGHEATEPLPACMHAAVSAIIAILSDLWPLSSRQSLTLLCYLAM